MHFPRILRRQRIAAGLLTVVGRAMREAAQVKAENEGFV